MAGEGGGISAGTIYIDAKVRLDEASARQAVTQAQGQAGTGGTGASRGARVSPGANAASDSGALPPHLRQMVLNATGIPGGINQGVNTSVAGAIGTGGLGLDTIKGFVSQQSAAHASASNVGIFDPAAGRRGLMRGMFAGAVAGGVGSGGLDPRNVLGSYISQRDAANASGFADIMEANRRIAGREAGDLAERNALVSQFRRGRRDYAEQQSLSSERDSAVQAFRNARDQTTMRGVGLESFGGSIGRQQGRIGQGIMELATQEQDLSRVIKEETGLRRRRLDTLRTGLGNAGSAIGRAANANVLSTGMFMNFLFGGWEVNTASNAAAMGQSAARANAFDPSAAFKAERAGLDRIMGGPMGSLVGMFNQGGVLAADSTFLAGERGGGRADAQQARRQEIEISGMRAGGAGQTFLNAKQLQIQREREMKGELDLEKSERSASAEAARQKAINDYKTGRIEWVETGDIFNPNKRADAKGQSAYDAIMGDDNNVRGIKSSRKQITDNDAIMFLKELGGEYRDIGRGFAGIGRGVMGAAKNVFEQMQGQFVQAGNYNAMAQSYGMMGTNPLGAQLVQIESQRQQALFQNRHAMPQVITGLNAGFDAYKRFAQQQDGNSRTMLRGGMLNDLASAGLHASGRQFSAESQNIFGGAMNAYTGFAQQGDMENAGLALQTGRAQLVSFRQSLIDRGIGSAQTGMGAFRTDFSGGASRPNQESIKQALKTTEDHLANISKMISNMGIQ